MEIIHNPYINHKLGYYVVGNLQFDSKIRACLHAVETKQPVTWVFNNAEFKSYDWSVEPEESLDQLYDLRARQLRETYDYLILSYSGGSDSHNVFEAFHRQGLLIDEIITNTVEKGSKGIINVNSVEAFSAPQAEHEKQTVPRLKEIAQKMPGAKITVTDQTDFLFDHLTTAGDASWVLDKRESLNPAGVTRFNYLHFTEVRKRFDKNYKIGLIVGVEKPRTFISRGEFFVRFADRATNMITIHEHLKEYPNSTVEFFYWSPDCVPMIIKQCHVIKKYLELNPALQAKWTDKDSSGETYRLMHEPVLRNLLYSTWDGGWYQSKKAILDWYSEFDQWFQVGYKDTNAFHVWQEGLNFVADKLHMFTKNASEHGGGDFTDGLKTVVHTWKIGKMNVLDDSMRVWLR
jgi:hypothetical protein